MQALKPRYWLMVLGHALLISCSPRLRSWPARVFMFIFILFVFASVRIANLLLARFGRLRIF